jgi:hypothetical protein
MWHVRSEAMSIRDSLKDLLDALPEERLQKVRDFAEFLARQDEQEWQTAARRRFGQAYGADEPDYTEADVKPELDR